MKGKDKPIKVFELIGVKDEPMSADFAKMMEYYEKGLIYYRIQEWDKAIDCFEYCRKLVSDDPVSEVYRKRCMKFKEQPPGQDWDGVTTLTEK